MRRACPCLIAWFAIAACVALQSAFINPARAQGPASPGKPVALIQMGQDARLDNKRMLHNVIFPAKVAYETFDSIPPADRLGQFGMVFIWGVDQPVAQEQLDILREYVAQGGTLVHSGAGLFYRGIERKYADHPWLGALAWNYHNKGDFQSSVMAADHPFFKGLDFSQDIAWLRGPYSIKPNEHTTILMGREDLGSLTLTRWQQGKVIWISQGLFRMGYTHREMNLDEAIRLYANILQDGNPLLVRDQLSQHVTQFQADPASLIVWRRDWQQTPQAGPWFEPAYPAESEHLRSIAFHSAIDERDTAFALCQSLTPQEVKLALAPLTRQGDKQVFKERIKLHVSDQPPVVTDLVPKKNPDWPAKLGRYHLRPITDRLAITDEQPRVLWLELDTHGLAAGRYESVLTLQGQAGRAIELPISLTVYPVRMPSPRLVDIRLWGDGFPNRQPFLDELQRQGVGEMYLGYVDMTKVRLRETGLSLQEARTRRPELFRSESFPILDFTQAYDSQVLPALDHGITRVRIIDVRTAEMVARAAGGPEHAKTPYEQWPEVMQRAFTGYMAQLYGYFQSRGFTDVDILHGDEPSMESIRKDYLPKARLATAGGMGFGTTWTTPGFDKPEHTNEFAPHTTGWSMYTIMMPRFLDYLRTGQVKLHDRATVGILRGGWGLALRNSPAQSRTYVWNIIHYGRPLQFISTGPIWKEWLYYIHTDQIDLRSMPEGVSGERLLAYGSADRQANVPLWSSSDWEATRDGVDDANLDRILTLTLDALEPAADAALKRRIAAIRADRASWFAAEPAPAGKPAILLKPAHYEHKELKYDFVQLVPPGADTLDQLKRKLLEHLASLAQDAHRLPASLHWNQWQLAGGPAPAARVVIAQPTPAVKQAIDALNQRVLDISGLSLPVTSQLPAADDGSPAILIGLAGDPHIQQACRDHGWQVDDRYPGANRYLIYRDASTKLLMIAATSDEALAQGVRHFAGFLQGRHHWFASEQP